jgi:putative transposase
MPEYRRYRVPGGTYFFTLKTELASSLFNDPHAVRLLREVFRNTIRRWPFELTAFVLLPDHLHAIWTLPTGDADYSTRWAWLKKEFTRRYLAQGGLELPTSESRRRNRRKGIWQRRFWEHTIQGEQDFDNHFDYIHWNPVKHGYARSPAEWRYSSFHRWASRGIYPEDWGRGAREPTNVATVLEAGE